MAQMSGRRGSPDGRAAFFVCPTPIDVIRVQRTAEAARPLVASVCPCSEAETTTVVATDVGVGRGGAGRGGGILIWILANCLSSVQIRIFFGYITGFMQLLVKTSVFYQLATDEQSKIYPVAM